MLGFEDPPSALIRALHRLSHSSKPRFANARNFGPMSKVARHAKTTAKPGRGGELARRLLAAAEGLGDDPGCELYLVNRQLGEPDVIWVTELWRSQTDLDAATARIRGSDEVAATIALTDSWEMIELELLGGKGPESEEER
jgi:quinol monooxygenase YgiN